MNKTVILMGLLILPFLASGCSTKAQSDWVSYQNTTPAQIIADSVRPTDPLTEIDGLVTNIQVLDALAKKLSRASEYKLNKNDCTQFTGNFVEAAVSEGFTCRYVSGIGWNWNCHAWSECQTDSGLITVETTPSKGEKLSGEWSGTTMTDTKGTIFSEGVVINGIYYKEALGVIRQHAPLQYIVLCAAEWNQSQSRSCEESVCNKVLKQKYLNNTAGDVNG